MEVRAVQFELAADIGADCVNFAVGGKVVSEDSASDGCAVDVEDVLTRPMRRVVEEGAVQ